MLNFYVFTYQDIQLYLNLTSTVSKLSVFMGTLITLAAPFIIFHLEIFLLQNN